MSYKVAWVCERCLLRDKIADKHYTFIASPGESIVRHKGKEHKVVDCTISCWPVCESSSQSVPTCQLRQGKRAVLLQTVRAQIEITLSFISPDGGNLTTTYGKLASKAYVAAVVFQPCKKRRDLEQFFNQMPCNQTLEWKEAY